ncbi:DUF4225 domain-containing protein [Serratia rubidaea]|uniref:DUF4225 domain-containing protein n=1 Tax=Serratia rubidaea TaxID=61652 RepID=A0A3S4XFD1_SERRU|nr:DUF4225 domain-containing protein [Serratia rubidaea]MBH1930433.1 DUF4225 domain-containing protein [Serratia rubidaea]MDC6117532.1 DUF4225 domain-containing protein [Serratia rubidaea]MEB7587881.1 DUF4225 domain-containing protein [Serratia rubidaea]VEI65567.1 Uncharacterised protein [Serratia rubidaea]
MDISLLTGQRTNAWSATMINLEARKLINTANIVAANHLQDGLSRIQFIEDIKSLINQQFSLARKAKSDEEGIACIKSLRAENESLLEQDRLLKTRAAQLYAKVEFIRENNKVVGYVISAVQVVLAGMQVAGGVILASSMTPVGVLLGATLVIDAANTISKEVNNQLLNKTDSQGFVADTAMSVAEFMGFRGERGLAAYKTVSLAANAYSVFGLLRKPGSWRLFYFMRSDFYRKMDSMSRPKLTMKVIGYGLNAKIVFDLLTIDNPPS